MYKSILSSTLPLVITLVLFIVVGNYGIGRVLALQSQITTAKSEKATLTQKFNTLQSVSAIASTGSQSATAALPDKNPALITLTQLKSVAAQNSVVLSNLRSGSGALDLSGLFAIDLSLDVSGSREAISAFLDAVEKIAPITLVEKIKYTENGAGGQASVTVRSYWAELPKTVPSVSQSISDLTPDEIDTLTKLSTLAQPQFVEVPPSDTGGKTNPFTQ